MLFTSIAVVVAVLLTLLAGRLFRRRTPSLALTIPTLKGNALIPQQPMTLCHRVPAAGAAEAVNDAFGNEDAVGYAIAEQFVGVHIVSLTKSGR